MSRKGKPRRKYRPRPQALYGGLPVLAGRLVEQLPLTGEEQTNVLAEYVTAIDAMLQGRGTFLHFEKLVYGVNVARVLADYDADLGREHEGLIISAMEAVERISRRGAQTQCWTIADSELPHLYSFEDLLQAQLEVTTKAELEAALKEMWRRINAGMKFEIQEPA